MSATRLQNCLTQLRSRAGDKKNANGAFQCLILDLAFVRLQAAFTDR